MLATDIDRRIHFTCFISRIDACLHHGWDRVRAAELENESRLSLLYIWRPEINVSRDEGGEFPDSELEFCREGGEAGELGSCVILLARSCERGFSLCSCDNHCFVDAGKGYVMCLISLI